MLKPADISEKRQQIPPEFYSLLDKSKRAFESVTATEHDDAPGGRGGGQNDAYILKRLKAKEVARTMATPKMTSSLSDKSGNC